MLQTPLFSGRGLDQNSRFAGLYFIRQRQMAQHASFKLQQRLCINICLAQDLAEKRTKLQSVVRAIFGEALTFILEVALKMIIII
jgi:hypothetical protein